MKKILLLASTAGLLFATSCKKEEANPSTNTNDSIAVTDSLTTTELTEDDAKAKVEKAKTDLEEAIQKGVSAMIGFLEDRQRQL